MVYGSNTYGGVELGGLIPSGSINNFTDILTFTDSFIALIIIPTILSDTLTFLDYKIARLNPYAILATFTDKLTFNDILTVFFYPPLVRSILFDSIHFLDGLATFLKEIPSQFMPSFHDTLVFYDLLKISYGNNLLLEDLNLISDSLNTASPAPMGNGDFLNFSDQVEQVLSCSLALTDSIVLADTPIGVKSNSSSLNDSISLSDSILAASPTQLTLLVVDSIILSDGLGQVPSTSFNSYIRRYLNDVS